MIDQQRIEAAIRFYDRSPDAQFDDLAALALREWLATSLKEQTRQAEADDPRMASMIEHGMSGVDWAPTPPSLAPADALQRLSRGIYALSDAGNAERKRDTEIVRKALATPGAGPVDAVGDGMVIGKTHCFGDKWFKEITIGRHTLLALLDGFTDAAAMLANAIWPRKPTTPAPVAVEVPQVLRDALAAALKWPLKSNARRDAIAHYRIYAGDYVQRLIEDDPTPQAAAQVSDAQIVDRVMGGLLAKHITRDELLAALRPGASAGEVES